MLQLRSSETEKTSVRDKLGIHLVADSLAIALSEEYLLLKGRGPTSAIRPTSSAQGRSGATHITCAIRSKKKKWRGLTFPPRSAISRPFRNRGMSEVFACDLGVKVRERTDDDTHVVADKKEGGWEDMTRMRCVEHVVHRKRRPSSLDQRDT